MKQYCYPWTNRKMELYSGASAILLCVVLLVLLVAGAWVASREGSPVLLLPLTLLCGTLICLWLREAVYGVLAATRQYALNGQGLMLTDIRGKETLYPWAHISNICICTVFRKDRTPGQGKNVIWFSLGRNRWEPPVPSYMTRWNSFYRIVHYPRSLVVIACTPEVLEAVKRHSGREVPDYRN